MEQLQNLDGLELTLPIIRKAQKELLPPDKFYRLCQDVKTLKPRNKLYFLLENKWNLKYGIKWSSILIFFDYLSQQIRDNRILKITKFYLYKIRIRTKKYIHNFIAIKLRKSPKSRPITIEVEVVGEGMIGRVARINIEQGEDLAFKAFFDINLVWQHGPWAEIPMSIYLQAHQVTKNIPQFKCAGENWAIWEWIYPSTKPDLREGITYEQFARENKLTPLNYLNYSNYNPYQIRLDLGGLQKEYLGRRCHDLLTSILFYIIKLRQEGLSFLFIHITTENISYFSQRLIRFIFPKLNQPPKN